MKKSILIISIALLIAGIIGCTPAAQAPKTDKVAYLIIGALGDKAFYDSGQLGIDQLAKEYGVDMLERLRSA